MFILRSKNSLSMEIVRNICERHRNGPTGETTHFSCQSSEFIWHTLCWEGYSFVQGNLATILAGEIFTDPEHSNESPAGFALRNLHKASISEALITRVLNSLHGDFCGVLMDLESGGITLISSKMGLLPLYYYSTSSILLASDDLDLLLWAINAIGQSLSLDEVYVASFLLDVPPPEFAGGHAPTIYKEIRRVPAAHYVAMDVSSTRIRRYWTYWDKPKIPREDAVGETRDAFLRAVKLRACNTKNGVMMSGGLDSSSVVCALAHVSPQPIYGYSSISEAHASQNERAFAEAVMHQESVVPRFILTDHLWAFKDVPDLLKRPQPEPFQGWFYSEFKFMGECAKDDGVKVMMSGEGGDQLFDLSFLGRRFLFGTPPLADPRKRLQFTADLCRGKVDEDLLKPPPHAPSFMSLLLSDQLRKQTNVFERIQKMITDIADCTEDVITFGRLFAFQILGEPVEENVWLDREFYQPHDIRWVSPFRDDRLVELVFSVPVSEMVMPSLTKPLLRKAMKGLLPNVVRKRKLKTDYGAIYEKGVFEKEARRLESMTRNAMVCELGFVNESYFQAYVKAYLEFNKRHVHRVEDSERTIWRALLLEFWLQDQLNRGKHLRI